MRGIDYFCDICKREIYVEKKESFLKWEGEHLENLVIDTPRESDVQICPNCLCSIYRLVQNNQHLLAEE